MNGTAGVPTVFLGLLDYMAKNNKKLNYLKVAAVGGAACPPNIIQGFDRYAVPCCALLCPAVHVEVGLKWCLKWVHAFDLQFSC